MKKTFFTPGPTELFPSVKNYINEALEEDICSINHRSEKFMKIYKSTVENLRSILNFPDNFYVFFLSSATEAMDRIIQNTVAERSFHFVNGAFAERFFNTSIELGKRPAKIDAEYGESFNFDDDFLNNEPELICFTLNETSTGVAIPAKEIYKIKSKFPEAIIAVDIVTAVPYYEFDYTKIDCAFFSVQKGFGLPSGLGVLIVNQKCIDKSNELLQNGYLTGSYHNFLKLHENSKNFQTTETPNVLNIFLLGKISTDMNNYGIEKIRSETDLKAELIYNFLDEWKSGSAFVKEKNIRSKTTITAMVNKQKRVKDLLSENGYIVGSGYGKIKNEQIRIANFPMHKIEDVKNIIDILNKF